MRLLARSSPTFDSRSRESQDPQADGKLVFVVLIQVPQLMFLEEPQHLMTIRPVVHFDVDLPVRCQPDQHAILERKA
jgi:hypothetical protein